MRRLLILAWVVSHTLGCGRLGFDSLAGEDAGGEADGNPALDADPGSDGSRVLPGLIAHYSFDTAVTTDSTGQHHATCVNGCPALDPNGRMGSALSMDGGPSHLRVVDDGAFDTAASFTVVGWVRYRTIAARTCVFAKPLGGSFNSWALCTDSDQRPFFYACDTCDFLSAPDPVGTDVWIHLGGSFDGTTKRLYIDGIEVASADGPVLFDATAIVIGGDDDGAFGFSTDGLIDELQVYDRALQPAEIASLAGI